MHASTFIVLDLLLHKSQEIKMDNLFCNEEDVCCLMISPPAAAAAAISDQRHANNCTSNTCTLFYTTNKQDCEEAFKFYLQKELTSMPENDYLDRLKSDDFVDMARCKSIHWLIQSWRRLKLSIETVCNAANYLDRFISLNQCHEWKSWTVELLSVACLSTASKFCETAPPALHDVQMEGLEHMFQPRLIKEMELKLLQTLDWRLNCTTPYSYLELIKPHLILDHLYFGLAEMLLSALLDFEFLAFRPSVIATCALQCIIERLIPSTNYDAHHLAHFVTLIPQDQMDDVVKCQQIMVEKQLVDQLYNVLASDPSSPATVLTVSCVEGRDHRQLNFKMKLSQNITYKKRKLED